MGFYTEYFGHMTTHTCAQYEYPCGFVLSDDWLSIFYNRQSISPHGSVYISSQHPGVSPSANQISWSKYSTHGYQEGLPSFWKKVHQSIKDFKQATSINGKYYNLHSIVFFNVVDHTVRLELSDKSNCNLTHGWHMPKLIMELHCSHPLLLFLDPFVWEWSDLLQLSNNSSIVSSLFSNSSVGTLKWDPSLFHFAIFTPNCECH